MTNQHQLLTSVLPQDLRRTTFAVALVCALIIICTRSAQAQTYTVLHTFSGRADGSVPYTGLTIDKAGNLYGTTQYGGDFDSGTAFRLAHRGSGWTFTPLYQFQGGADGQLPQSRLIIGRDGTLYGTTELGGTGYCPGGAGCGTIFSLKPPPTAPVNAISPWTETVLYRFTAGDDSFFPGGDLAFDSLGNLFGAAAGYYVARDLPGYSMYGSAWKLSPSQDGWTFNVLYDFNQQGWNLYGGVILDQAGNLYGTTGNGGSYGVGTVFQLTHSDNGWTENTLHDFQSGYGFWPHAGVVFDQLGNLYGITFGGGKVFQLSPSGGGWAYDIVTTLLTRDCELAASLTVDTAGALYGSQCGGGAYGHGALFMLVQSNGGWTYISLHDFTGGSDGGQPQGSVLLDSHGNIYGTTAAGGAGNTTCYGGCGVVFQITP